MKQMSALVMLALLGCAKTVAPEVPAQAPEPSVDVVKSPTDDREYLYFELDNGLRVMAISDDNADRAAAALDVHIGQFSDPEDRQGLSHFLEHMLFMGTEKYPDVDGYRKFIQDHGGGTNAGTGQEHTTYFFYIDQPFLEPALDRFAQFFIAPKLDAEYVDRERNAVNAEYSLKIKDEARRNREVRRITHNPAHPFHKFSVGNLDTLGDRGEDLVWDDLKQHYQQTYSASRMAVTVIGREDVQTLKQWVTDKFAAIPSDAARKQASSVPPFLAEQLGVRIQISPLQDTRSIELRFPGPSVMAHWQTHPTDFLTELLGQEGPGSLHDHLKSRGWIDNLYSYTSGTEDYAAVVVGIRLTEDGYGHIDDIVDLVFQNIRLIEGEGVDAAIYQENARIAALDFQFADEVSPTSVVRNASRLQSYPPEHFNDIDAVYGDFDADLVREYLATLTPENLRLIVVGPDLETDRVEPLYQTPYSIHPLDPALITRWSTSEVDAKLVLPPPNPFIADDVSLLSNDDIPAPKAILDTDGLTLWHDLDVDFAVPQTRTVVDLRYPITDIQAQVTHTLLIRLVNDSLESWRYQPSQAGVYASLQANDRGSRLVVSGYNEKQPEVLDVVAQRLADFHVDTDRFAVKKAELERAWRNFDKQRPMTQTYAAVGQIFDPDRYTPEQGLAVLKSLDADDIQQFADHYLEGASAEILVHGNTDEQAALALAKSVQNRFLGAEFSPVKPVSYRRLPIDQALVLDLPVDHNDSTFIASYQGDTASLEEQALYLMLAQVLETPFFTELRTNQQLGYSVRASYTRWHNLPGLTLAIQSANVGPVTIQTRIDSFLADFGVILAEMSDDEYATIRAGLVASLTEKDTTLRQRSRGYSDDLFRGYAGFDRKKQLAEAVSKTEKSAVLARYQARIATDVGRLIVRSFGDAHQDEVPKKGGCDSRACVTDQLTERYERALK